MSQSIEVQKADGAGQNDVHTVNKYLDLPEFANGCRQAVALATLEE
jgi:tripeptide aminopeptidase